MTANRLLFPRRARLLKAEEFRAVFKQRRWAGTGALRARLRPNGRTHARLGLAIGRKALRRAVDRNRVRRQVRESFRLNQRRLSGLDIVVSMHQPGLRTTNELWPQLPELWKKVVLAAQERGKWKG